METLTDGSRMALVLLMGVPGAGKTTLGCELLNHLPSSVLFSLDELAGRKVDNFDAHKSRKDFELAVRRHIEAAPYPESKTVIVDDIFYLKSMRRPFERMARAQGFQLAVVFLEVDFGTALARNKLRGDDQLSEETICRIFDDIELSPNCLRFSNLPDLIHRIEKAKRTEPRHSEEPGRQAPSLAEVNEKTLRRCVKQLVEEGADGKRLGRAKKKVWSRIKGAVVVLEEEEVKSLLRDEDRT